MKYYIRREGYKYTKISSLNACQEDKYDSKEKEKTKNKKSEVIWLLTTFIACFILIFLPCFAWSGIERCLNINYVNHICPDGSRIVLTNNPNAADPTYEELVTFLKNNHADQTEYNLHSFLRAQKLHDKAEEAGYRCAWVSVCFTEGEEQACNSFNTTDRGIVFVDHTNWNGAGSKSSLVDVNIGEQYIPRNLLDGSVRYNSVGTVKDYTIYW